MSAKTVAVGTANAAPGTVARGAVPVTTLAGGTPVEIPVDVVNGAAAGPVFWVNGAIHGDKPEGLLACQIALAEVDPAKLSGTLVMVPVVNVPAFEAAQRGALDDDVVVAIPPIAIHAPSVEQTGTCP